MDVWLSTKCLMYLKHMRGGIVWCGMGGCSCPRTLDVDTPLVSHLISTQVHTWK